ncbi:hypothetical protein BJV82DRAFT_637994 [Fennellomyces sp. T-0311]|nr:hypothetical protein BJV82DRAFT_637994 [Fennellomyces sp. T-0311]
MYSAEHKEDVLVYAPLLLIEADNPCHSDLCCLKGLKTLYCCRSCYFHNKVTPRNSPNDPPSAEALNAQYRKRTRADYVAASSDPDRRCRIAFGPVNADGLPLYKTASELGFKKTGAEDLLKLEAFDPSQDTPVEVLHTIMLGIVKYMVQGLYRNCLKNNPDKLQQMHNALRLNYSGSFVGRDFKQLIQVLPIILTTTFKDDEGLQVVAPVFVQLGKLSSLVFMRSLEHHFDDYLEEVRRTITDLTREIHVFDKVSSSNDRLCSKPKLHILHHLPDNIKLWLKAGETWEKCHTFLVPMSCRVCH